MFSVILKRIESDSLLEYFFLCILFFKTHFADLENGENWDWFWKPLTSLECVVVFKCLGYRGGEWKRSMHFFTYLPFFALTLIIILVHIKKNNNLFALWRWVDFYIKCLEADRTILWRAKIEKNLISEAEKENFYARKKKKHHSYCHTCLKIWLHVFSGRFHLWKIPLNETPYESNDELCQATHRLPTTMSGDRFTLKVVCWVGGNLFWENIYIYVFEQNLFKNMW